MPAGGDTAFTVTTLGTGVAFPAPDRGPSSTLVRYGETTVLVDCGTGALQKLHAVGAHILEIDAVLITHAHVDHLADLIPLLFALYVPGYDRRRPLTIRATPETFAIVEKVRDAFGDWLRPEPGQVELVPTRVGDTFSIGDLAVETGAVFHHESSIAWRLRAPDGRLVAVPGDSGPCDALVASCRDADLAVLECAMPDDLAMPNHLSPTSVAATAHSAGIGRLVITHRYPAMMEGDAVAEIRARWPGDVVAAADLDTFDVPAHHAAP